MSSLNINQQPIAFYKSPSNNNDYIEKILKPDPLSQLQNDTLFAGPSEKDRDAASVPPIGTPLGDLRRQVVSLQLKINEFLTERMVVEQAKKVENNKKLKTLVDDENIEDDV